MSGLNRDLSPQKVWRQYWSAVDYNARICLYDTVKRNENFFIGRQWEGVNAPDLDKPVNNILKRVATYFIAQLVSDDVTAQLQNYRHSTRMLPDELLAYFAEEINRVIENARAKELNRQAIRDAAVDGDACVHLFYDPDAEEICMESIDNTQILFGNPQSDRVERQPYLMIVSRRLIDDVRREARESDGEPDSIVCDYDDVDNQPNAKTLPNDGMVTVITRYWRHKGRIHVCKTTAGAWVRRPKETDLSLYPVAYWSWDRVKNSYHGQAAITALIANQIIINKLEAMLAKSVKDTAFPKIVFDETKMEAWSNRVGEAIGVKGNPNEAVARVLQGAAIQPQIQQMINDLMTLTRDTMGASDAALGNVKPDNTSAIIAVQKASSAPLELQRMAFYQWIEDYVRIMIDMMHAYYGKREVLLDGIGEVVDPTTGEARHLPVEVDFGKLDLSQMHLNVNIGASAYWSELTQLQTLDNLYAAQLIEPLDYLESVPDAYLPNKAKLVDALKRRMEQQQMRAQVQAMPMQNYAGLGLEPATPTGIEAPMAGTQPII